MASGTFVARFKGTCAAGCGAIHKGDEVMYDGQGGLVHAECSTDIEPSGKGVCDVCHVERPCWC